MIISADIKTLKTIDVRKSEHEKDFDVLAMEFARATLQTWKEVKQGCESAPQTAFESENRQAL